MPAGREWVMDQVGLVIVVGQRIAQLHYESIELLILTPFCHPCSCGHTKEAAWC